MLSAYIKELHHFKQVLDGNVVKTIFFGGGTPSLASPQVIAGIIDEINKGYTIASDVEITMEANPTSIEAQNFAALADAGINRVSIGIQSFNQANLQFLGREHSVKESLEAIEIAKRYFKRYSLDLIYTLPQQQLDEWLLELEMAYNLANGHLSLYQLTIEKGTKFYQDFRQHKFSLPNDDLSVDFYTATNHFLLDKGMYAYEVSNYATPGQECQHNLTYWNYKDYVGIGAGAHGRYTFNNQKYATQMLHNPEQWLTSVQQNGSGLQQSYILTPMQTLEEQTMMGLRLSTGISQYHHINQDRISFLCAQGLLSIENNNLKATNTGRLVLNSVLGYLLAHED